MVVIDAVVRLIPGVLGDAQSAIDESFGPDGGLEYPQYTRPRVFRALAVPEILLSGDHAAIADGGGGIGDESGWSTQQLSRLVTEQMRSRSPLADRSTRHEKGTDHAEPTHGASWRNPR